MQAVAGATLCIAILMNAPTGFLDFLLRIPWEDLGSFLPRCVSIPWGQVLNGDEKNGSEPGLDHVYDAAQEAACSGSVSMQCKNKFMDEKDIWTAMSLCLLPHDSHSAHA